MQHNTNMKAIAIAPVQQVVTLNLETIRVKQLIKRLTEIVRTNLSILDKTRSLSSILKGPVFNEIITSSIETSEYISEALTVYNRHINALEQPEITLADVSIIDEYSYSGWVDRVKEIIVCHSKAKEMIVALFSQYDAIEFRELFVFLKRQLEFHQKEVYRLRNSIEQ